MKSIVIGSALMALMALGCSDDSGSNGDFGLKMDLGAGKQDGSTNPDTVLFPDLGALPDLGAKGKCDSEWRTAVNPQTFSSTGAVTTATVGGLNQTKIDATAGGMGNSSKNPFVYVSLKTGKRVDLDDYKAKASTAWDVAFKRAVVRINGGDSGAGAGAISIVSSTTIDKVTSLPATSTFAQDDFLDANCKILKDPIGMIKTAIGGSSGMWYTMGSISQITPKSDTYVIKLADGSGYVKMVIDTYYGGATNKVSANYTIRWTPLK